MGSTETGGGLDTLQTAIPFQPSINGDPDDEQVDRQSYPGPSLWHKHPELFQGCETDKAPLKVAVLLSGGVDSSLALHLLHAAGHQVTAFYLQIWFQEDFRNFWDACPWEEDLTYCRAVCDRLNVPLEVVPLSDQYWDRVVSHSISEIKQGRTPNPDVLCNSRVKFGAFLEILEEDYSGRFDRIASGHYARLERQQVVVLGNNNENAGDNIAHLALTPDAIKDQTYFLAHLNQQQLSKISFPLGHLTKEEVRGLARAADLPNQDRKDSQGICFLGKVKFSEFVKEHLGEWPGPLIEEETDEVVGYHRGFWFHTVGQRKGIFLSGGPWYVTRKDPNSNAVYVSRQYYEEGNIPATRSSFKCGHFNWTSDLRPDLNKPLNCKVRHGPNMYSCTLRMDSIAQQPKEEWQGVGYVELDGIDQGLSAGQYAVFYQDGYCLGCAVIL